MNTQEREGLQEGTAPFLVETPKGGRFLARTINRPRGLDGSVIEARGRHADPVTSAGVVRDVPRTPSSTKGDTDHEARNSAGAP